MTVTIVNGHRVCQAEAVFRRRPLYLFADLAHAGYVHPLKWSNDFVWFSTDDEAGEIIHGVAPRGGVGGHPDDSREPHDAQNWALPGSAVPH